MILVLVQTIQIAGQVITILIIAKVLLSWFMNPWHPVRSTIDRLVEPLLAPIRRIVPPMGMFDFSPFVLLILIQLLVSLLTNTLLSL